MTTTINGRTPILPKIPSGLGVALVGSKHRMIADDVPLWCVLLYVLVRSGRRSLSSASPTNE